ncbi:hypothetical protein ACMGE6_12025 [Macrococcus equi]|uniref:hypothetical protein n=1 Tax=Macrococcus equi TaxID=3395462 RepID=UPI0039BE3E6F
MKRRTISNIFILLIVAYFIWLISRPEFYISDISMHGKNPITISWHYFTIDTDVLGANNKEDDYQISLYPFYVLLLLSFIIRFIPINKKHKE